ncbi:hypothetical protein, partial [Enterobacter intestinihominis]
LMPSPQTSPTGDGANIKNRNPTVSVLHLPCRHRAKEPLSSVFSRTPAIDPVCFKNMSLPTTNL